MTLRSWNVIKLGAEITFAALQGTGLLSLQMNSLALELGGVQPYPLSSTLHVLVWTLERKWDQKSETE